MVVGEAALSLTLISKGWDPSVYAEQYLWSKLIKGEKFNK
jgi:hypothetical protein